MTDEPDLDRAARDYSDGMYHGNLEVTENGYWVEAKDLRVGDVFLGANAELSTLTNIVRVEQAGGIAVFNFTVEGNHDYFILAKDFDYGQSCVLVHNADYFVKNGVHRCMVARETGKTKIKAEIFDANEISQGVTEIPLGNLHTSKDFVFRGDVNNLKAKIDLEGMKNPIEVERLGLPGQETPVYCILDVFY